MRRLRTWWRRLQYARYLRSAHWQQLRRLVLDRAGYRCERCGARARLEVHHLTYVRVGRERLTDLTALCRACHRRAHAEMV